MQLTQSQRMHRAPFSNFRITNTFNHRLLAFVARLSTTAIEIFQLKRHYK
jgi:hypothetical protein